MLDQILAVAVVLLPTVFAIGIEVIRKEIKEHAYWRFAVVAFGVGLSFLTGFQMARATKKAVADRNAAISETSERVSASVSKNVSKSVGDQYAQLINSLQTQIGNLEGQLIAQGKSVEAIKTSNVLTGKQPIKVEVANLGSLSKGEAPPDIHVSRIWTAANPQHGKKAVQFLLTTNKVMNGGRVLIACQNKINNGEAVIVGAGFQMQGGGGMVGDHAFQSGIGAPNWSPDFPLVVTLYFDEDDLGECTIKPLS